MGAGAQDQAQAFEQILRDCGLPETPEAPGPAPAAALAQTGKEKEPPSTVSPDTRGDESSKPLTMSTSSSAPRLSTPLVHTLLAEHLLLPLGELTSAFAQLDMRMRGGSLLVVWEGDEQRLEELMRLQKASTNRNTAQPDPPTPPPPLSLHLIDFAHSRFVPPRASATGGGALGAADDDSTGKTGTDSGPDEGVLKGLRTVRSLVEGIVASNVNASSASAAADASASASISCAAPASSTAAMSKPKPNPTVDHGWDRKLADALVLYDWVDIDEGISPAPSAGAGGAGDAAGEAASPSTSPSTATK